MGIILILLFLIGAIFLVELSYNKTWKPPSREFPNPWKNTLKKYVSFYKSLKKSEKKRFEYKIMEFLENCDVKGIAVNVTDQDKVLVAASAIIPIFAFPDWQYSEIDEIFLYPNQFDHDFNTEGKGRSILGMVGIGYLDRKMILSKRALWQGFKNETDKRNTAIHEFIHLVDKQDGVVDGIPEALLEKQHLLPWIDFMDQKMGELSQHKDIDPYAGKNQQEFLAVLGEYFFERPRLLKRHHPKLYYKLREIFDQNMTTREKDWTKIKAD